MHSKFLAIAAALLLVALASAAGVAQSVNKPAPGHQTASAQAAPATPARPNPSPSAPATPAPVEPSASSSAPPAAGANCPNGPCDYQPPHISIATPAPAPAPWPVQERIAWAANLLLVLIAYVGILLAVSVLRKIERQTRYAEETAQAAADSAKAALFLAEAQVKADRPWILVTAEPTPGVLNGFTVVATNRGRSPARIATLADEVTVAKDEAQLPPAPVFKTEPRAPLAPIILLPGESAGIKSFTRDEVKSVCANEEQLHRVEDWDEKVYLFGNIAYVDLVSPAEKQAHETAWCCWYIHGRQKSGMVMANPPQYSRHT